MPAEVGDWALVVYNVAGEVVYHSRLMVRPFVAAGAANTRWCISTPDNDAYEEDLSVGADIARLDVLESWKQYLAWVPPTSVYEFCELLLGTTHCSTRRRCCKTF